MTADHAARVQAVLDEHVASGRLAAPYFAEADIRAVLDELKQLRLAPIPLTHQWMRAAYRAGHADAREEIRHAIVGTGRDPETMAAQWVATVLGPQDDNAQQPERATTCPCGCPVEGDMCACPTPCSCEPSCSVCLMPNPMRQPGHDGSARPTITEAFHDPNLIKPEHDRSKQR